MFFLSTFFFKFFSLNNSGFNLSKFFYEKNFFLTKHFGRQIFSGCFENKDFVNIDLFYYQNKTGINSLINSVKYWLPFCFSSP